MDVTEDEEEPHLPLLWREEEKRGENSVFKSNFTFFLSEASDAALGLGTLVGFI